MLMMIRGKQAACPMLHGDVMAFIIALRFHLYLLVFPSNSEHYDPPPLLFSILALFPTSCSLWRWSRGEGWRPEASSSPYVCDLSYTFRGKSVPFNFTLEATLLRNFVQIPVTCALRLCTFRKYSRSWAFFRLTVLFFNWTSWSGNLAMENDKLTMLTDAKLSSMFKRRKKSL